MNTQLRSRGKEFGATTGRPRRVGWFDAVIARHSVVVNGIDEVVVTKLDVLDEEPKIKICTGYRYKGKLIKDFPMDMEIFAKATPVYETHTGWLSDTNKCRRFKDLPLNGRRYLKRIEKLIGARIGFVSIGSRRDETIVVK